MLSYVSDDVRQSSWIDHIVCCEGIIWYDLFESPAYMCKSMCSVVNTAGLPHRDTRKRCAPDWNKI